jgi:hypothetical protein
MISTRQALELRLDTEIDLTTASAAKVKYKKPDGTAGEWDAGIQGDELVYETTNADLDKAGRWYVQASVSARGQQESLDQVRQQAQKAANENEKTQIIYKEGFEFRYCDADTAFANGCQIVELVQKH